MKRTLASIGFMASALFALTLFTAQPAFADFGTTFQGPYTGPNTQNVTETVLCTSWYTGPTHVYPADNNHYFVCLQPGHMVDPSRANSIANWVEGIPTPSHDYLKNYAAGVTYYYFETRDDAYVFMNGRFSGHAGQTASTTARCGNTGTPNGSSAIVSEIYETCEYGGTLGSGQNPNVVKVTAHETGHAFDFAYGLSNGGALHIPSQSQGFKDLAAGSTQTTPPYAGDVGALTPCNWTDGTRCNPNSPTMTATQQAAYVCGLFPHIAIPSLLEQSFTVPNDAVCSASGTINSQYAGLTPTQIGTMKRAPYFIGTGVVGALGLWKDLFAEEFSEQSGSTGSPNPLLVTDDVLHDLGNNPCKTVSGVYTCSGSNFGFGPAYPGSAFHCTTWVLREFFTTAAPPPAYPAADSLKMHGCPDIAPSQFTQP